MAAIPERRSLRAQIHFTDECEIARRPGEFASATAFLIETAPAERRGFYGSWQMVGQGLAVLAGALLGAFITRDPKGSVRCAAVYPLGWKGWPLAVRRPEA